MVKIKKSTRNRAEVVQYVRDIFKLVMNMDPSIKKEISAKIEKKIKPKKTPGGTDK